MQNDESRSTTYIATLKFKNETDRLESQSPFWKLGMTLMCVFRHTLAEYTFTKHCGYHRSAPAAGWLFCAEKLMIKNVQHSTTNIQWRRIHAATMGVER